MLPFEVPPGTTLDSLFREVLPEAHAKLVPADADREPYVVVHSVVGFKTFTFEIQGAELRVREGASSAPNFWVLVEKSAVELFLADWLGSKRLVPKRIPKDAVALSDPRILKRLALVSGKAELALTDLEGARVAMTAATGAAARKPVEADEPDVTLEAKVATFTRLLDGTLPPEDAIADGQIGIRGKRLLAMQLAFAFAPFYPRP